MYRVYNQHSGETVSRHETLEDAGWAILTYDQRAAGFVRCRGEVIPVQYRHRTGDRWLHRFAADSEREALEAIALSGVFDLDCVAE